MSLSVSFRRSARAEFIETAARYESERQDLGVEFIAEVERCVTAAVERPMSYLAVYKDVRRVVAQRFPFSVYFRAEARPYRRLGRFPWQPGPRDLAAPDLKNDGPRTFVPKPNRPFKLASLRRESSNQLLETLEEWNDYLER
jgi:toxin ParE1/3/4